MSKNLNELILAKCRDQVASKEEWGKPTLEETLTHTVLTQPEKLEARMYVIERKAAIMAMEEQANFFRWVCGQGYIQNHFNDLWWKSAVGTYNEFTEEQLYEEYGRVKG